MGKPLSQDPKEIRVYENSLERVFAMGKPRKRMKIDHDSSLDTNNKNRDLIPMDIVNEILQRLPAKSEAKFVRVSKSWVTIIRDNYFINSFSLRRSMEFEMQQEPPYRYRLLFAFNEMLDSSKNQWTFFSSTLATTCDEKLPLEFVSRMVSQFNRCCLDPLIYVKGLLSFVCGKTQTQVISNPSTGKSIVLPIVKSRRKVLKRYFGFDPIKVEYKVLCITEPMYVHGSRISPSQNQVLTLGFKSFWREIDSWIPHYPISASVCIDGIIYYLAYETETFPLEDRILVRFDVRSEKFLKQISCWFFRIFGISFTNLMNYKSKLAIACRTNYNSIDLWILSNDEKGGWGKISLDISSWTNLMTGYVRILGTTPRGEIICTCYSYGNFYVIYHDLKKNQHRRRVDRRRIDIAPTYKSFMSTIGFFDYEESVMLL